MVVEQNTFNVMSYLLYKNSVLGAPAKVSIMAMNTVSFEGYPCNL